MNKKRHMLLYLPVMLALAWFMLLIWVYLSALFSRNIDIQDLDPADAALVLGNAVNKGGRPNPCLRSRVAAAADLYHAGKVPKLVVSGGTDTDGSNQARHMKAIAVELNVPESRIAIETKSENTYENILFSSIPLTSNNSVIIVSADYHLKRARWLADKQWGHEKTLQVYAGNGNCDDERLDYARKIVRESLAWVKASVAPE